MIAAVIDCSALVDLMLEGGLRAVRKRAELVDCILVAPHLVDAEFVSALRGLARKDPGELERIEYLIHDFHHLGLERFEQVRLTWDAWSLRERVTAYDAFYVALAARLQLPLITSDKRLARAARDVCDVRLLEELSAA